jgi:hypothetical protein
VLLMTIFLLNYLSIGTRTTSCLAYCAAVGSIIWIVAQSIPGICQNGAHKGLPILTTLILCLFNAPRLQASCVHMGKLKGTSRSCPFLISARRAIRAFARRTAWIACWRPDQR